MEKTKNVFISHYTKDEENILKMKTLLKTKGYEIKNSSIDSTKANNATNSDYIKQLLRKRISWAGKFICLIGPHTHERPWVNWEIEQANKQGKEIIGIYINGASDSDLPSNFEKYGETTVGWDSRKIIEALEENVIHWENPDGSQRQSIWGNSRSQC